MHLRSQHQHVEGCTQDRCVPACGLRRFDESLDAPLMAWEIREHARMQQRLGLLLAGEIPGVSVAVPAAVPADDERALDEAHGV